MLDSDESLIIDDTPLDYDYVPKLVKYREKEQFEIANSIKPLFHNRSGRNLLIYGAPGIGKSVAIRNVLNELEQETESVNIFYINCWHHNTTYKILIEICNKYGYHFTQNKKTIDLYKLLEEKINDFPCVFVFDEIDRVTDLDFLYFLLEKIMKKSIILVTNYKSWLFDLDKRIKSRLMAEILEFKEYNLSEIKGILQERKDHAFTLGVWDVAAFNLIVEKTVEIKDIRSGLFLLRESGLNAEERSQKKILKDNVLKAIKKLEEFTIKKAGELSNELKEIFDLIKKNNNLKIGVLFNIYTKNEKKCSYKTFQRRISKLAEGKFITLKKQTGKGGNTTIINVLGSKF